MYQKLKATLCCFMLSCALYGQNGWVPPVTMPANANVCDPAPWKLVLFDDFNGNHIDTVKWKTYTTWDAMSVVRNGVSVAKPDHPDWDGARTINKNALFKDDNVVVSNGTCKLLLKNDPNTTWHYVDSTKVDSITHNYYDSTLVKNLSGGCINTPFKLANGHPNHFNSGKFEARIRFPIFEGAWCAFWLWHGTKVNEIDIAEAWGGGDFPYLGSRPHNTSNLHAWGPNQQADPPEPNPFQLPRDAEGPGYYFPNQSWWDFITNSPSRHRQNYWHTYTSEWDTASIKTYLDFSLVNTVWKYYQDRSYSLWEYKNGSWDYVTYNYSVGSECNPDPGTWNITYGYPYNSNSESHLRLSNGFTDDQHGDPNGGAYIKDIMEIDYVKVWQKHPELDGHTDLCADNTYPATPVITGPNEICGEVAYTLSPATTGTWSTFNNDILVVGNPTSSGANVAKDAGPAFNLGWVSFSYGNGIATCPLKTVYKTGLYCNRSTDWMVVTPFVYNNNGEGRFHFIANLYHKRDVSGNTTPVVTWNVSINRGSDVYDVRTAQTYTLQGQYASTVSLPMLPNGPYHLKWTMNVTDASGTWSRSGSRNSKTTLMQQQNDMNTYYLNAYIDDQNYYETKVDYAVAAKMVSEEEHQDSLFIHEMIEKVKAEALEPYIITDGLEVLRSQSSDVNKLAHEENTSSVYKSKLKVYPNPTGSDITIIAGSDFEDAASITLNIYDLSGKCIYTEVLQYRKGNIMKANLSKVQDGNYILELKQGNKEEHIKITKAD